MLQQHWLHPCPPCSSSRTVHDSTNSSTRTLVKHAPARSTRPIRTRQASWTHSARGHRGQLKREAKRQSRKHDLDHAYLDPTTIMGQGPSSASAAAAAVPRAVAPLTTDPAHAVIAWRKYTAAERALLHHILTAATQDPRPATLALPVVQLPVLVQAALRNEYGVGADATSVPLAALLSVLPRDPNTGDAAVPDDLPVTAGELESTVNVGLCSRGVVEIAPGVGSLRAANVLQLCCNAITRLPPHVGYLTHLTVLSVAKNHLTELPVQLGHLSSLVELDVSRNRLTSLPASLARLTQLHVLRADHNLIPALPPQLGRITSLVVLDIAYNPLRALPAELLALSNLRKLRVRGCPLMPVRRPGDNAADAGAQEGDADAAAGNDPPAAAAAAAPNAANPANAADGDAPPAPAPATPRAEPHGGGHSRRAAAAAADLAALSATLTDLHRGLPHRSSDAHWTGVLPLRELAARALIAQNAVIDMRVLPHDLASYLLAFGTCSFCHLPYLSQCVVRYRTVALADQRVPVEFRLCKPHWDDETGRIAAMFATPAAITARGGDEDEEADAWVAAWTSARVNPPPLRARLGRSRSRMRSQSRARAATEPEVPVAAVGEGVERVLTPPPLPPRTPTTANSPATVPSPPFGPAKRLSGLNMMGPPAPLPVPAPSAPTTPPVTADLVADMSIVDEPAAPDADATATVSGSKTATSTSNARSRSASLRSLVATLLRTASVASLRGRTRTVSGTLTVPTTTTASTPAVASDSDPDATNDDDASAADALHARAPTPLVGPVRALVAARTRVAALDPPRIPPLGVLAAANAEARGEWSVLLVPTTTPTAGEPAPRAGLIRAASAPVIDAPDASAPAAGTRRSWTARLRRWGSARSAASNEPVLDFSDLPPTPVLEEAPAGLFVVSDPIEEASVASSRPVSPVERRHRRRGTDRASEAAAMVVGGAP
ncbi:hypothetical protein AMAG_08472 [Allomyces macrogynus ATCC 38327]|uniref:Disease resistance R13L4/SHOC-2-like LRR domain-containing protein n=1 Tax=Allomyces macrogynus (strain ATCC 38327) TaxID=578462 RepID=A0A0L0SLD7_ALLM3|nr:hypothetical protein AMAG_08472 [Allomyces macrogynus ATCC 38327]|eukprot:KNE63332.1 hypothetical protein AMAG_08472 [Allomyces macrogynus ATCC 38327]